ncbi:MAG: DUF4160 domain-containing protein [Candidatus Jettenia caeni]|nr:MAG: DUF4160 domain-containing protein [Candidatus Jettenia caeni]
MPTILQIMGWRVFFYANENKEPIHVHCENGDKACKYWIIEEDFEVEEAWSYNMNNKDKRTIRKILFENFDYVIQEWENFQKRKK